MDENLQREYLEKQQELQLRVNALGYAVEINKGVVEPTVLEDAQEIYEWLLGTPKSVTKQ